jgi:hypothetical protein
VRIIGSSGAALDRAAHPVLGARFSRPARPWRKLQCLRKGMRNVLCNRRTTRALKRVFTKNTGVRMCTVTVVTGKIHHRVTVKKLGKKDPRARGSGYQQNNPQFEPGNEGRSTLCERQKTGTSADSRCEIKMSKVDSNPPRPSKTKRVCRGILIDANVFTCCACSSMRHDILECIR